MDATIRLILFVYLFIYLTDLVRLIELLNELVWSIPVQRIKHMMI